MGTTPSRGRHDSSSKNPIELCEDDERKLWGLLDADVAARLRRIELAIAALFAVSTIPKAAELAEQAPQGVVNPLLIDLLRLI